MDKPTDKALESAHEVVMGYPKNWTGSRVCAYDAVDRTTGAREAVRYGRRNAHGDVCHAGLTYYEKKNVLVINAHKAEWQDTNPEYLKWCVTEAPYTHGVLNKDNLDELLGHGSIIDMGEIGQAGTLWICKAVRHFTEDTWVPETWEKLREQGLTGLQAFIGADILDAAGSPKGITHTGLIGYSTPANLRKVYDTLIHAKHKEGNQASHAFGYGAVGKVWGSLTGKTVRKPDGWGGYTEVKKPCDAKEYAAQLKEIFEGDPSNVG
jgi:hypothetical protein